MFEKQIEAKKMRPEVNRSLGRLLSKIMKKKTANALRKRKNNKKSS